MWELQRVVDDEGLLVEGRAHPAHVEVRAERILPTQFLVALRVPIGDAEGVLANTGAPRLQRRSARGVYAIRSLA